MILEMFKIGTQNIRTLFRFLGKRRRFFCLNYDALSEISYEEVCHCKAQSQ